MKHCATCEKNIPEAAARCVFCGAKQESVSLLSQEVDVNTLGQGSGETLLQRALSRAAEERGQSEKSLSAAWSDDEVVKPRRDLPATPETSDDQDVQTSEPRATKDFAARNMDAAPEPRKTKDIAARAVVLAPPQPIIIQPKAATPVGQPHAPAPVVTPPAAVQAPLVNASQPHSAPPVAEAPAPAAVQPPSVSVSEDQPIAHPRPSTRPPYLASEAEARTLTPFEPWARTQRRAMLVFGAMWVATFFVPWATSPQQLFAWHHIAVAEGGASKAAPIVLLVAGLLLVVLAAVRVPTMARGVACLVVGIGCLLFMESANLMQTYAPFAGAPWAHVVVFVASMALASGLLIRARYRGALLGRMAATLGALSLVMVYLVHRVSGSSLLAASFKGLGRPRPGTAFVLVILILLFAVAVASLVVWIPRAYTAAGTLLAWLVFVCWSLLHFGVAAQTLPGRMWHVPGFAIYPALISAASLALACYGLATLAGKLWLEVQVDLDPVEPEI